MIIIKYLIGDFSHKTGLSIDTLRYYEKEQLLYVGRDQNNRRIYSDKDIDFVKFILRLKRYNMPIKQIREYAKYRYQGDSTTKQRYHILKAHQKELLLQEKDLKENLELLNDKLKYYEKLL